MFYVFICVVLCIYLCCFMYLFVLFYVFICVVLCINLYCSMYLFVLFCVFICVVLCINLCCSMYLFVLFYVFICVVLCIYLCCSMYCLCVNVYCHRVTTQLQLINISYHTIYHISFSRDPVFFAYIQMYKRLTRATVDITAQRDYIGVIIMSSETPDTFFLHSCTVHLDTIEYFIYPTDAQLDCS